MDRSTSAPEPKMEAKYEAASLVENKKNNLRRPKSSKARAYLPQVFVACSVSLANMLQGFVSGFTAPALVSMKEDPLQRLGEITNQVESWTASLLPLFAILGGTCGGVALDRLGRQKTIQLLAIPYLSSFLVIGFAQNIWHVYAGRCIAGFAIGISSMSGPVYLGEALQADVRGFLGIFPSTLGNVGFLICFCFGGFLDWTQLAFFGATITTPFIICMFFVPETPRWYISKGDKKRALKSLQWLRGGDTDVTLEFNEIEKVHQESLLDQESVGCTEILSHSYRLPLIISIGLMLFKQISGSNAVLFYNTQIFKSAKSSLSPKLCTSLVGVINLVAGLVVSFLMDRLGRKVLLYASGTLMAVTITILGVYFRCYEIDENSVDGLGWIPMASFGLYVIGFAIGFGPVPWLMMGEIFPAKVRGTGASIATAFNWTTLFVVSYSFKLFGSFSTLFSFYGVCCFISLFFVFKLVPETRGKSLEEIERMMVGVKPVAEKMPSLLPATTKTSPSSPKNV